VHRRVFAIALCAAALVAVAAPSQAGAFICHLKAPGHHPHAGEPWKIKVTARTKSGRPLHANAIYKFLYHGQVVHTASPYGRNSTKRYPFYGHFRDTIHWPPRSIGYRIKFRVIVRARHRGKEHRDYWVRVRA
jgi:hypothetical protein